MLLVACCSPFYLFVFVLDASFGSMYFYWILCSELVDIFLNVSVAVRPSREADPGDPVRRVKATDLSSCESPRNRKVTQSHREFELLHNKARRETPLKVYRTKFNGLLHSRFDNKYKDDLNRETFSLDYCFSQEKISPDSERFKQWRFANHSIPKFLKKHFRFASLELFYCAINNFSSLPLFLFLLFHLSIIVNESVIRTNQSVCSLCLVQINIHIRVVIPA